MLVATLPPIYREDLMRQIIANPYVSGFRYNIGMRSPFAPRETLMKLLDFADEFSAKTLYIDLKGRQLRIAKWADPTYGDIVLNHEIEVDLPARIIFRGGHSSEIKAVNGNRIFVDPPPQEALGAGQAVNIDGVNLKVNGFLTEEDLIYLELCKELGIDNVMISFVEEMSDILQTIAVHPNVRLGLKIESPKGAVFALSEIPNYFKSYDGHYLVAARDDYFVNFSQPNKFAILRSLKDLVGVDSQAILASRIFSGLETVGEVTLADISDLTLMWQFGYRKFMLSDGISHYHFDKAIEAWGWFYELISS